MESYRAGLGKTKYCKDEMCVLTRRKAGRIFSHYLAILNMRNLWLILAVVLACLAGGGCISRNSGKFQEQVKKWVPLGTPVAKAQDIMEHKGFDCMLMKPDNLFNTNGIEYLECEREQVWFHDWHARIIIRDDKVSEYGPAFVK